MCATIEKKCAIRNCCCYHDAMRQMRKSARATLRSFRLWHKYLTVVYTKPIPIVNRHFSILKLNTTSSRICPLLTIMHALIFPPSISASGTRATHHPTRRYAPTPRTRHGNGNHVAGLHSNPTTSLMQRQKRTKTPLRSDGGFVRAAYLVVPMSTGVLAAAAPKRTAARSISCGSSGHGRRWFNWSPPPGG